MKSRVFPPAPTRPTRTAILAAALLLPVLVLRADPLPATEPERPLASPAPKPPAPLPATPKVPSRTAESALTPVNRNPGRHVDFLERIKQGPIGLLFLGDSITDGWNRRGEWTWLKFAPYNPANFGVSGERTEDVLWRITHGELDGISPKVTVLMIGTNNIGQHKDEKAEWATAGVRKVVETIHEKLPQTRLLLLGVFPRDKAASPYRTQIKEINESLAKLDDGGKTRYLDIGHVFLDTQGEIPKEIMPDALHPDPAGYLLWYDAMHPLLEEMLK